MSNMAVSVQNVYSSVGCNRVPHSLDWGINGLVCFGASHAVTLFDPKFAEGAGKLLATLSHHMDRVNCVRWIRNPATVENEKQFVSASSDKSLVLWNFDDKNLSNSNTSAILKHSEIVTIADGIVGTFSVDRQTVLISCESGGKLYVWQKRSEEAPFELVQTITFTPVIILDARVTIIRDSNAILVACACDDGDIHLFVGEFLENKLQLRKVLALTGHEDWVRVLDFTYEDNGDLLLASAAQDSLIRVWKITEKPADAEISNSSGLFQSFQRDFRVVSGKDGSDKVYTCALESVLSGHENWIYGLHWQPRVFQDGQWRNPLRLLSASMDKTMIIWGLEQASGLWMDQVRVGEVGGNTLGFYGCRFGQNGTSILAHGYQGALHMWHYREETNSWDPGVVCSGHFGAVEDLAWDPQGEFVISLSSDQTTRVHAPWVRPDDKVTWHEIGRPQVHGHDLACLGLLDRFLFASGAEEKVIRIFAAPRNFRENLARLCRLDDIPLEGQVAEGASVPALGLSNKPVFIEDIEAQKNPSKKTTTKDDQYPEFYFTPMTFAAPPTEETLIQNTLWPEIQKLYGHGYELFSLAADIRTGVLASASRAQQAEHASIRIWNTKTWKCVAVLAAHALTVTQMAFSPDGSLLLSVSRDRSWAVHRRISTDEPERLEFRTVAKGSGGSRIIWSCDWSPDSRLFITGSRDKHVAVWSPQGDSYAKSATREWEDSVTAVAFGPQRFRDGGYLMAVGLDNGRIDIAKFDPEAQESEKKFQTLASLNQSEAHHLTVKRLKFRPVFGAAGCRDSVESANIVQLASAGADHAVKVFTLTFAEAFQS